MALVPPPGLAHETGRGREATCHGVMGIWRSVGHDMSRETCDAGIGVTQNTGHVPKYARRKRPRLERVPSFVSAWREHHTGSPLRSPS